MKLSNKVYNPIITEKAVNYSASENKYTFKVAVSASKGAVANEISKLYGVEVEDVKTCIMPGKKKRIGKTNKFTKTSKWKKAIVKLKDGQKIDIVPEKA